MFDLGYIERISINDALMYQKVFELGEEAQECEESIRNLYQMISEKDEGTKRVVKLLIPLAKKALHLEEIIYKMEVFRINEKAIKISTKGYNSRNAAWLTHDGFLEYYECWRPLEQDKWPKEITYHEDPSKLDYETVKKCYKQTIRYGVSADDIFNFLKSYIIIRTHEQCFENDDENAEDVMEKLIPGFIGHEAFFLEDPGLISILRSKNPRPFCLVDFLLAECNEYEASQKIVLKFFASIVKS